MDRPDAAHAAAEQFIAAILSGDGGAITTLMSPKAQSELLQAVHRWDVDVSTAQDAAARVWGGPWVELLRDVRIDTVQIEGERATATYSHPTYGRDPDDFFPLLEVDGRWLVNEFLDDRDDDDIPPWALSA